MKKVVKKEVIGIQPVFSTNVDFTGNYITDGEIINKNCIIDENYQNECHINLTNVGSCNITFSAGDKLVQGLVIPVNYCQTEEVADADALYGGVVTDRGQNGFGSTDNQ